MHLLLSISHHYCHRGISTCLINFKDYLPCNNCLLIHFALCLRNSTYLYVSQSHFLLADSNFRFCRLQNRKMHSWRNCRNSSLMTCTTRWCHLWSLQAIIHSRNRDLYHERPLDHRSRYEGGRSGRLMGETPETKWRTRYSRRSWSIGTLIHATIRRNEGEERSCVRRSRRKLQWGNWPHETNASPRRREWRWRGGRGDLRRGDFCVAWRAWQACHTLTDRW